MPYFYYDATYFLVILGMLICLIASARVKNVMKRYSDVRNMAGSRGGKEDFESGRTVSGSD